MWLLTFFSSPSTQSSTTQEGLQLPNLKAHTTTRRRATTMESPQAPGALQLDLRASTASLLTSLHSLGVPSSPHLSALERYTSDASALGTSDALAALAELLLEPLATMSVATHMEPLVPELVSRALDAALEEPSWAHERTLRVFHALARLLGSFENLYQ